jgi:DNA-binding transcriptional regulator YiaG
MPNIAALLKEEITRLARRELRRQTMVMRKASAQYRRHIAALKREAGKLARQVARLEASVYDNSRATAAPAAAGRVRFAAKGLRAQRERLDLSAADYAKLAGVSAQSIYNWERGIARPRPQQIAMLAAMRGMKKREARARLERLDAKKPRKRGG